VTDLPPAASDARGFQRPVDPAELGIQSHHVDIDPETPSTARMYDWFLGGKDNFAVDRRVGERALQVMPEARDLARANRGFLIRAVRRLAADEGVEQFIDVGSGIPTSPNVHEVAREAVPGARVVYVDNDPIVTAHNRALRDTEGVVSMPADVRDPEAIVNDAAVRRLIDFDRPVAVLFVSVLHFLDPREEDVAGIVARYRRHLATGSYLAASIASADGLDDARRAEIEAVYAHSTSPILLRTRSEIEEIFGDADLMDPGLVPITQWHAEQDPMPLTLLSAVGELH